MTYAVIANGGKQYKVRENEALYLEKIEKDVDETIEISEVVMLSNNEGEVTVGTPYVANAKVVAKIVEHGKDKKALIFKKKRRKDYKIFKSHRQPYTKVMIEKIEN